MTQRPHGLAWLSAMSKAPTSTPSWATERPTVRDAFAEPQPSAPADDTLVREHQAKMAELDQVVRRYRLGLSELLAARENLITESIGELTELAFAVGKELALKELTTSPDAVSSLIRQLVMARANTAPLRVRLAAQDYAALHDTGALQHPGQGVEVIADPSLSIGSCLIEATTYRIDATFETRQQAVRDAMQLGSPDKPRAAHRGTAA